MYVKAGCVQPWELWWEICWSSGVVVPVLAHPPAHKCLVGWLLWPDISPPPHVIGHGPKGCHSPRDSIVCTVCQSQGTSVWDVTNPGNKKTIHHHPPFFLRGCVGFILFLLLSHVQLKIYSPNITRIVWELIDSRHSPYFHNLGYLNLPYLSTKLHGAAANDPTLSPISAKLTPHPQR